MTLDHRVEVRPAHSEDQGSVADPGVQPLAWPTSGRHRDQHRWHPDPRSRMQSLDLIVRENYKKERRKKKKGDLLKECGCVG